MEILVAIFGQLLTKTSVFGAVAALALIGIVLLLFAYTRAKIELMRQEADAFALEQSRRLASDESSRQALMEEIRETRRDLVKCIEQGNRERNRSTRTMGSLCAEMRAQAKALDSMRVTIDSLNAQCATRVAAVKEELIRLEDRGGQ